MLRSGHQPPPVLRGRRWMPPGSHVRAELPRRRARPPLVHFTWPGLAVDELVEAGLIQAQQEPLVRALVAAPLAGPDGTVAAVAAAHDLSRRRVSQLLRRAGLPAPRQWLALGRSLAAAESFRTDGGTLWELGRRLSWWAAAGGEPTVIAISWRRWFGAGIPDVRKAPEPAWKWLLSRWCEAAGLDQRLPKEES